MDDFTLLATFIYPCRLPLGEESASVCLGMIMARLMGQVPEKTLNCGADFIVVLKYYFGGGQSSRISLSLGRCARLYPRRRSGKGTHSSSEEAQGQLQLSGKVERRAKTKRFKKTKHFLVHCALQ